MAQATILLADDNPEYLDSKSELIRREGFQVVTASSPSQARSILETQAIDVAVLDLRLEGGGKDDISGLDIAMLMAPRIPKIILTAHSETDVMIDAFRLNSEGLPRVVEWITKDEKNDVLIEAIRKALVYANRVRRPLIGTTVFDLDQDFRDARMQVRYNYWIALLASIGGIVLIFVGAFLSLNQIFSVGILSAVAGVITEAVGILAFRRVDAANLRMDSYHKKSHQVKQLEILLATCEELPATQEQSLKTAVIDKVASNWFGSGSSSE